MSTVIAADEGDQVDAAGLDGEALPEHAVEAGHQVHAGHDHGGGVDEGGDRRGAGHGVGQPHVQRELGALAHDAEEQEDSPGQEQAVAMSPVRASRLMCSMLKFWPAAKNRVMMPSIRPTSPMRVVMKALMAASELAFSSHQWPMSMNEHSPTSSQPISSWSVLSATTRSSMEAVNSDRAAKK